MIQRKMTLQLAATLLTATLSISAWAQKNAVSFTGNDNQIALTEVLKSKELTKFSSENNLADHDLSVQLNKSSSSQAQSVVEVTLTYEIREMGRSCEFKSEVVMQGHKVLTLQTEDGFCSR